MLENYDHAIIIKKPVCLENETFSFDSFKSNIVDTFKLYMGERLLNIECHNKTEKNDYYLIGLLLNPEMLHEHEEKGPLFGTEEAKKFKELWGDRSNVVHVNGAVHECVSWPERGNLTLTIVNFIMQNKLGYAPYASKAGWHQVHSEQLKHFIQRRGERRSSIKQKKSSAIAKREAFDGLNKMLLDSAAVKKLPIQINELRLIGAWSRSTDVFPVQHGSHGPQAHSHSPGAEQTRPVYHVAILTEANNKWPSDIDALKLMKTLYLAKLHKTLQASRCAHSRVLADNRIDIFVRNIVFRCALVVKKELTVLSRMHTEAESRKRKHASAHCQTALVSLAGPIREYLMSTDLVMEANNQIRSLVAQFGHVFSDTCRLTKRWLASQLIELVSDTDERLQQAYLDTANPLPGGWCMSELAVELLVASLFVHPAGNRLIKSAAMGFLLLLKLISRHDWAGRPLVVNINRGLTAEQYSDMSRPFLASDYRHTHLPMMVIRTPANPHGDHWTSVGPNRAMLEAITELARQAYACCSYLLVEDADLAPLFVPDLSRFDVLFHLRPSPCCGGDRRAPKKSQSGESKTSVPTTRQWEYDDNAVEHVARAIRELAADNAMCCHDRYDPRFIGLHWVKRQVDRDFIIASITQRVRPFLSSVEKINNKD